MFARKFLLVVIAILLNACGILGENSQVDLINGERAFGAFPAVRLIHIVKHDGSKGECSGFFISDSLMLSAAHCLVGARSVSLDKKLWLDKKALSWRIHGDYDTRGVGRVASFQNDIALIKFSEKTSSHWLSLSEDLPSQGQAFTMVGFGSSNPLASLGFGSRDGGGVKRFGKTYLDAEKENIFLTSAIDVEGKTQLSASAPGDSGGPAIYNQKVFGILVGNHTNLAEGAMYGYVYSLHSPSAKAFFKSQCP